jgi:hypothetical protein
VAGLAKAFLGRLVVVAQRHGGVPRVHVRGLGQLQQVELVAVALEPGDEMGELVGRRHAPEAEQLVELDAGVELVRLHFERDVLDHVRIPFNVYRDTSEEET